MMEDSSGESLGNWLDARLSDVDEDLATRIRAAVPEPARSVPSFAGGEALAVAAGDALRKLLTDGCETRGSAPDLLVVDALVTYACQVAAERAVDVGASADVVLREIIRVSSGHDGPNDTNNIGGTNTTA